MNTRQPMGITPGKKQPSTTVSARVDINEKNGLSEVEKILEQMVNSGFKISNGFCSLNFVPEENTDAE
jgi:hypothetical protein